MSSYVPFSSKSFKLFDIEDDGKLSLHNKDAFFASFANLPPDTKLYICLVLGDGRCGKSLLLNTFISHLYANNFLRGECPRDFYSQPNTVFESRSDSLESSVTHGCDMAMVYLRDEGEEEWVGGVLLLIDCEGMNNMDCRDLSLLMAISSQITDNLIFVANRVVNNNLRKMLEKIILDRLIISRDDSIATSWRSKLHVVLNFKPSLTYLDSGVLDRLIDTSQEQDYLISRTIPKEMRSLFTCPQGSDQDFTPNSTVESILSSSYGVAVSKIFQTILPSILQTPIAKDGIPMTSKLLWTFFENVVHQTNESSEGKVVIPSILEFYLSDVANEVIDEFIVDLGRPSGCGDNDFALEWVENIKQSSIEKFTRKTLRFSNLPAFEQALEVLSGRLEGLQTAYLEQHRHLREIALDSIEEDKIRFNGIKTLTERLISSADQRFRLPLQDLVRGYSDISWDSTSPADQILNNINVIEGNLVIAIHAVTTRIDHPAEYSAAMVDGPGTWLEAQGHFKKLCNGHTGFHHHNQGDWWRNCERWQGQGLIKPGWHNPWTDSFYGYTHVDDSPHCDNFTAGEWVEDKPRRYVPGPKVLQRTLVRNAWSEDRVVTPATNAIFNLSGIQEGLEDMCRLSLDINRQLVEVNNFHE